jgi:hypothetical protein
MPALFFGPKRFGMLHLKPAAGLEGGASELACADRGSNGDGPPEANEFKRATNKIEPPRISNPGLLSIEILLLRS